MVINPCVEQEMRERVVAPLMPEREPTEAGRAAFNAHASQDQYAFFLACALLLSRLYLLMSITKLSNLQDQ